MLQDFYINDIIETIENDEDLYSIMNKRILFCKNLKINKYNGGPPDICYMVRENQTKGFFKTKHGNKYGAYHYIYGLDTSNIACISTYITTYLQKKEKLIKNLNSLNQINHKTIQSIFCAFDFFYEKDLRLLIKFPGGIKKIFYIDDSQAIEANPDELRTVFLSSMLRSWCFNEFPVQNNCLFLEEINNTKIFDYLVDAISYIISERTEYKFPKFEKKLEIVLFWFVKYLMSTRRFSFIITYFSKLSFSDSSLSKYVLKPLNFLNCYADGLQFIATLLCSTSSPLLICYEIELLTILGKYSDAMELGKYITSINPECPDAWLALAKLYLKEKKFEQCLKALNNLYYLKDFIGIDNKDKKINNNNKNSKNNKNKNYGIVINEIPMQKLHLDNINIGNNKIIKYTDLLYCPRKFVDFYYNSSQFYLCENSDVLNDAINKILTSSYFLFDKTKEKAYMVLLDIIKEINFDTFIDLKSKIFYVKKPIKNNLDDIDDKSSISKGDSINDHSSNEKIPINSYFEEIVNNLIEDLKIFSVAISQEDGNNYFQALKNKEDLAISEIKFCISFAIISERLKYYHTALKYYIKAMNFCFSKFLYYRIIILYSKLKDFKSAIITLSKLLRTIPIEQLRNVNKTPIWIDKIVLKTLFDYQASDIIFWIDDYPKHIKDFFKVIINKYKFWVEAGHELHLIK